MIHSLEVNVEEENIQLQVLRIIWNAVLMETWIETNY